VNNSLPRLIDGMVATLRKELIPNIEGEFARGQAFGIIYMLNSLKLRVAWSSKFLGEQLRALEEVSRELKELTPSLPGAPVPDVRVPPALPEADILLAARDDGDARLCELIDWLAANGARLPPDARTRAESAIDRYLSRQSRYEMTTSAKPMFVEMSGGAEKAERNSC
jgi:hypothetical protein